MATKRGAVRKTRREHVSALLIILNVAALLAFVYLLLGNQYKVLGKATGTEICAALGGSSCVLGTACSGELLAASDVAQCCTGPCIPLTAAQLDFNGDAAVDRQDFELLGQHLGLREDAFVPLTPTSPSYDLKYDLYPDTMIDALDATMWGIAPER